MNARLPWLFVGFVSLGSGIAGAVLPLVPMTPFLLLAAFAFARSSPRMQDWLLSHPQLGTPIKDWQRNGTISRRSKAVAVLAMILTLASTWLLGAPTAAIAIQAIVLGFVAAFVLTRPSWQGEARADK